MLLLAYDQRARLVNCLHEERNRRLLDGERADPQSGSRIVIERERTPDAIRIEIGHIDAIQGSCAVVGIIGIDGKGDGILRLDGLDLPDGGRCPIVARRVENLCLCIGVQPLGLRFSVVLPSNECQVIAVAKAVDVEGLVGVLSSVVYWASSITMPCGSPLASASGVTTSGCTGKPGLLCTMPSALK